MKRFKKLKITLLIILTISIVWTIIAFLPKSHSFNGENPQIKKEAPLLIAHQGGNLEFPGDTLEALYNAYSIDPNCLLEIDVNMTKDEEIILIHDTTLGRTTNLDDIKVSEVTYVELMEQEVDFGYDYYDGVKKKFLNYEGKEVTPLDVNYPSGVSPRHETKFLATRLEDVIKAFPNNLISIEIKQEKEVGLRTLELVIEIMDNLEEEYNTYKRISLASFNEDIQAELVKLKQTTHKNLMYSPATNGVVKFFILQLLKLDVFYNDQIALLQIPMSEKGINLATKGLIKAANNHNIAVHYWTINNEEDMHTLIKLGADGIMTDCPTLLKQVLDEYFD